MNGLRGFALRTMACASVIYCSLIAVLVIGALLPAAPAVAGPSGFPPRVDIWNPAPSGKLVKQ